MPAAVRVRTLIRAVTSMGSPVAGVTVPGLEGSVGFGSVSSLLRFCSGLLL